MRRPGGWALASLLLTVCGGCSESGDYETAVCALVDVSGTYADEVDQVATVLRSGVLPEMLPGDSLFLIAIDSESYDEDNLLARLTLDRRPSRANAQKLAFAAELEQFASSVEESSLTDISGALMLCSDYLQGSGAGTKLAVIFSDMQEELPAGVERSFGADQLAAIEVVAINVIKLRADNVQPAAYRERLAAWESRLLGAGAESWQLLADPIRLAGLIHPK